MYFIIRRANREIVFHHLISFPQPEERESKSRSDNSDTVWYIFCQKKLYHVNEVASRAYAFSKRHFLCLSLITSDEKTNRIFSREFIWAQWNYTTCERGNYPVFQRGLTPDLIIAANWMIIFIKPLKWLTVSVCPSLPSASLCLSDLKKKWILWIEKQDGDSLQKFRGYFKPKVHRCKRLIFKRCLSP